jgi:hypothetical protein
LVPIPDKKIERPFVRSNGPEGVGRGHFEPYNLTRCHLSLGGDAPEPTPAQGPALGRVAELPEVGGLHHRYEHAAA